MPHREPGVRDAKTMMRIRSAYPASPSIAALAVSALCSVHALADPAAVTLRQEFPDPPIGSAASGLPLVGPGGAADATVPFRIGLDYRCAEAGSKRQVLLSVADTVQLTDASTLASPQTLQIDVPLAQLRWLQPGKACMDRQNAEAYWAGDGVRYFRLRTGATAFATLTCMDETGSADMAIATAPLDVWLGCDLPPPTDAATEQVNAPDSDPES